MIVKMFQPRFADLVAKGLKKQTIRPLPKRFPEPGDILSCRKWKGRPYRSKQIKLYTGTITNAQPVSVTNSGVTIDGEEVKDLDAFAVKDGFENWDDMKAWFTDTHNEFHFKGVLISWQ